MSSEPVIQPAEPARAAVRPYADSLIATLSAILFATLLVALADVGLALLRDTGSGSGGGLSFLVAALALYAPPALAVGVAAGLVGGAWRASFGDDSLRRLHGRLRADRQLDAEVCAWLLAGGVAAVLFAGVAALLSLRLVGGVNRAGVGAVLLGGTLALALPVMALAAVPVYRVTRHLGRLVPRVGPITSTLLLVLVVALLGAAAVAWVVFYRLDWRALDLGIWVLLAAWAGLALLWLIVWRGPLSAVRRRIPARSELTLAAVVLAIALPAVVLRGAPSPRVGQLLSNQSTGARVLLRVARSLDDRDGDGYSPFFGGGDCDDSDAEVYPGRTEIPGNGKDDNCIGGDKAIGAAGPTPAPAAPSHPAGFSFDGNLVIVLVDTVRADRLGVAGYRRDGVSLTPRIDGFAGQAVRFTQARSQSPNTPRALPSIFSARYPSQVHYQNPMNNFSDLEPDNLFMWEILQRAKIHTVGLASHFYFVRAPTIIKGFDDFDNGGATGDIAPSNHDIASPRIVPKVEDKLAALARGGQRFAMFVHLFEPHSTYMEHPEFPITEHGVAGLAQKYDYEIAFVDGFVGRILDAIDADGLAKNTMVVILADHGEAFGVHRFAGQTMFFHGQTVFEELLRVPLLIRVPGVKPAVVDTPVMLVDLVPTVLDVLGVDATKLAPELADRPFMGRSLLPALLGKPLEPRPSYAELLPERTWNHGARALISADGTKKIIYVLDDRHFELYDLTSDPEERKDLWDRQPELAASMKAELTDWMDGL